MILIYNMKLKVGAQPYDIKNIALKYNE